MPRGRTKLAPMHPTTRSGKAVHESELGTATGHLFLRTARLMGLPIRMHGSKAPMLATTGRDHKTC